VLVIVNDNNYPGTGGRGKDIKDPTEFIRIRTGKPIDVE
jgi:glycerophosphoryl diester phosphodiesterase